MSSSADLNKIHVTNTTGLSLNDRFTAIASTSLPPAAGAARASRSRSRSRARSVQREFPPVNAATSLANARLLKNLARKHSVQAALKLKRRSMRNARTASILRGNTLRRNGVPANVGTMRSDLIAARRAVRPLRRSNSMTSVNGLRAGVRRPIMPGGAAERVARRQMERLRTQQLALVNERRGRRSRSRSRVRAPNAMLVPRPGRSRSRGRMPVANAQVGVNNLRRARSNSRNRAAAFKARRGAPRVSIKDRLGLRPGAVGNNNNRRRGNSISQRGVANGRVEKRRNVTNVANGINGTGKRFGRERARSAVRNAGNRSRSMTRRGQVGKANGQQQRQQPKQQWTGNNANNGMERTRGRSRSRQRVNNGRVNNNMQRNGGQAKGQGNGQRNGRQLGRNNSRARLPKQQQQKPQQQRGRSRSRNARGGVKQAKNNAKPQVSKDALDKELDQYMATTKTESNMDYILNN